MAMENWKNMPTAAMLKSKTTSQQTIDFIFYFSRLKN
jgi:hypothetical protein